MTRLLPTPKLPRAAVPLWLELEKLLSPEHGTLHDQVDAMTSEEASRVVRMIREMDQILHAAFKRGEYE